MKKIFILIFILVFVFSSTTYAYYEIYKLYKIADYVYINGEKIQTDLPILKYEKNYYIPLNILEHTYNMNAQFDYKTHSIQMKSKVDTELLKILNKDLSFSVYLQVYNGNVLDSHGSGVIVGTDLLLTAYHLIKGRNNIKIITENDVLKTKNQYLNIIDDISYGYKPNYDKYSFSAIDILYKDENRDIAILKIPATNVKSIKLGDSDKLEISDDVITVSSPFGFFNTITRGIVSNFRNYNGQNYIQTDASTNSGSSGGALINAQGELVGIIVMTLDKTNNINLTIPINEVKDILNKFIK